VTWDDWNLILDTNLREVFLWRKVWRGAWFRVDTARIINIGSVTSVAGYAGLGPYGAKSRRYSPADHEPG